MKIAKKLTVLAVSSLMMFSVAGITASAATVTQDGLNVSLTTDKTEYKKDEPITATLTVENTSGTAVKDVKLENIVPEGYELAKDYSLTKSVDELKSNDKVELTVVYNAKTDGKKTTADGKATADDSKPAAPAQSSTSTTSTGTSVETAKTGDTTKVVLIVLIIVAALVIGIICFKKKKGKQLLSIAVCASVLSTAVIFMQFNACTAEEEKELSVAETVTVDKEKVNVNAVVKYAFKGENLQSSTISDNNNNVDETITIKRSLSNTLDCMINNDFKNGFHYLGMYGDIKEQLIENEIPSALAKNITYEIENVEINQDKQGDIYAVVDVSFNSVDMVQLISNVNNEETYRTLIIDKLNNKNYVEKVFDAKLIMIKINGLWYLYETDQLNDVFMGGLYSLDMDLQDEYFKELYGGNKNG